MLGFIHTTYSFDGSLFICHVQPLVAHELKIYLCILLCTGLLASTSLCCISLSQFLVALTCLISLFNGISNFITILGQCSSTAFSLSTIRGEYFVIQIHQWCVQSWYPFNCRVFFHHTIQHYFRDIFLEKHWRSVVGRSVCDQFFDAQTKVGCKLLLIGFKRIYK